MDVTIKLSIFFKKVDVTLISGCTEVVVLIFLQFDFTLKLIFCSLNQHFSI